MATFPGLNQNSEGTSSAVIALGDIKFGATFASTNAAQVYKLFDTFNITSFLVEGEFGMTCQTENGGVPPVYLLL